MGTLKKLILLVALTVLGSSRRNLAARDTGKCAENQWIVEKKVRQKCAKAVNKFGGSPTGTEVASLLMFNQHKGTEDEHSKVIYVQKLDTNKKPTGKKYKVSPDRFNLIHNACKDCVYIITSFDDRTLKYFKLNKLGFQNMQQEYYKPDKKCFKPSSCYTLDQVNTCHE